MLLNNVAFPVALKVVFVFPTLRVTGLNLPLRIKFDKHLN